MEAFFVNERMESRAAICVHESAVGRNANVRFTDNEKWVILFNIMQARILPPLQVVR